MPSASVPRIDWSRVPLASMLLSCRGEIHFERSKRMSAYGAMSYVLRVGVLECAAPCPSCCRFSVADAFDVGACLHFSFLVAELFLSEDRRVRARLLPGAAYLELLRSLYAVPPENLQGQTPADLVPDSSMLADLWSKAGQLWSIAGDGDAASATSRKTAHCRDRCTTPVIVHAYVFGD